MRLLKRGYDLLAAFLLPRVLAFAALAWALRLLLAGGARLAGLGGADALFDALSRATGIGTLALRIGLLAPVYLAALLAARRLRAGGRGLAEKAASRLRLLSLRLRARGLAVDRLPFVAALRRAAAALPAALSAGPRDPLEVERHPGRGAAFTVLATILLVPFVLQPTLVRRMDRRAWLERAANLMDGTASDEVVASAVGLYRRLYAEPVAAPPTSPDELDVAFGARPPPPGAGEGALMSRWDPLLAEVVGTDERRRAAVKAFMLVESAGSQYAVSRTGCLGLLQFCGRTAREPPFRRVFGTGQVYACGCEGPCAVAPEARRALESGDARAFESVRRGFPCDLTDARFDPRKAIAAGALYVDRLGAAYGWNLPIMYVGYNSGPRVADRVWAAVGRRSDATIAEIAPALADALAGAGSAQVQGRARGLVESHLPKLERAFARYLADGKNPPRRLSASAAEPPPPGI